MYPQGRPYGIEEVERLLEHDRRCNRDRAIVAALRYHRGMLRALLREWEETR